MRQKTSTGCCEKKHVSGIKNESLAAFYDASLRGDVTVVLPLSARCFLYLHSCSVYRWAQVLIEACLFEQRVPESVRRPKDDTHDFKITCNSASTLSPYELCHHSIAAGGRKRFPNYRLSLHPQGTAGTGPWREETEY